MPECCFDVDTETPVFLCGLSPLQLLGDDTMKLQLYLFHPDSLELREHLVIFQSTTLQGQAGIYQELTACVLAKM